jgi:CRISPR/Cas system CSM-associated protein Csm3 (group 7 of RAMP superfamily)
MSRFKNRWKIQGILTTLTPLHIGDGKTVQRRDCAYLSPDGDAVEIVSVATDIHERAYVPGTALKGNLRAWTENYGNDEQSIREIFGVQEAGGKAEFWDAYCVSPPADDFNPGRCWSGQRLTAIAASVAIDRRTRTASARKLFYREFVPPGISFEVTITAQDLTKQELDLLLCALHGFNHDVTPVALGARTSDHWGRLKWDLTSAREMNEASVTAWLNAGAASIAGAFGSFSTPAAIDSLTLVTPQAGANVVFDLELEFSGLFLVNDPSQRRERNKDELVGAEILQPVGHAPTCDESGQPFLPAASFRGALRSQAERILRTIGGPSAAWHPGEPGLTRDWETISDVSQLSGLCLASQVFGAPGWHTPIGVTDFKLPKGSRPNYLMHEMVAIDRFTGAGAEGLKFNAKAVCQPSFQGTVTIDLDALKRADCGPGGLLLLAFTLRDLLEGDIAFGFGAGKGYGACRAIVRAVRWPEWEKIPDAFRKDLEESDIPDLIAGKQLSDALQIKLLDWFEDLNMAAVREE